MFTEEQRERLAKPLDETQVRVKSAGTKKFPYLPQFTAKRTMNEIFGPGGWSYTVTRLECLGTKPFQGSNPDGSVREGAQTAYLAVVRLTVYGDPDAVYEEVGFGDSVEYGHSLPTHEGASKEAVSDALKRCMMNLGDPLGLALWDKESEEHKGALGHSTRTQRQAAAPKVIDERGKRRVMAAAGEHNLDDDERHRLIFFVTRGRTATTNEVYLHEVKVLVDSFAFYAEHRDEAEAELREFEADPAAYIAAEKQRSAA